MGSVETESLTMFLAQSDASGPIDAITRMLEALGLPGLIIAALGFIAYKLYDRNIALTDKVISTGENSVRAQEAATAAIRELTNLFLTSKGKSE